MTLDKIIVLLVGIAGIIGTYWFFFMKKDHVVQATGKIDITVQGGYSPSVIEVPVGQTTLLNFFRTDPSACVEEVVMPDFTVRTYLPLNKKVTIKIHPEKPGEYPFSCGMNMVHGKIIAH